MVGTEISKELVEETYRAVETAKATGKITKGCNETTKGLERGVVKFVVVAKDVEPKEVVLHLPALSKDKGVVCVEVPSREELGAAAGLHVKTACIGIVREGDSKKILSSILEQVGGAPLKATKETPEKAKGKKKKESEDDSDSSEDESNEE